MEDVIGADELEELMAEMGISGGTDVVGAIRARGESARAALNTRRIVPNSAEGRGRQFPMGFTVLTALAAAASTTLTATPDRRCLLRALVIDSFVKATGVRSAGVSLTTITVQGRNARVGSGNTPALALQTWALEPMKSLALGVCDANATVTIGLQNNTAIALDVEAGCLAETVD